MDSRYVAERVGQAVLTLFVVLTGSFWMIRQIPGGPVDYLRAQIALGSGSEGFELARTVEKYLNLRPDKPLHEQYANYLISMAQGDLGTSFTNKEPVADIIAGALPWTLLVMTAGISITFAMGIVLGGIMAFYEGSRFDTAMTTIKILSSTVPYYVFAIILVSILAFQMDIFPTGGRYDMSNTTPGFNVPFLASVLHHAALPIISLILAGFGGPALTMRGNAISTLGSDYVRVGRLRGLRSRRLIMQYVVRNSVLPLYTGFMISIGAFFGGSVILEQIFNYPGMGFYFVQSFSSRDYSLMMGVFVVLATVTILGVLIADLTYSLIDPRIEEGEAA